MLIGPPRSQQIMAPIIAPRSKLIPAVFDIQSRKLNIHRVGYPRIGPITHLARTTIISVSNKGQNIRFVVP